MELWHTSPVRRRAVRLATIAAATVALACPVLADDDAFVEVDPTTVLGKGELLLQQWFGWTHSHSAESFNGLQGVTELDYGLTDRLQLAFSVEYDWERSRRAPSAAEITDYPAFAAEMVYAVIPARDGRFGLSFAFDPYVTRDDRGFEVRALMQRSVFGLQNVLNIGFDNDWSHGSGRWTESSGISVNYGVAFPLTAHWTVSLEMNNERGFDGLFPSGGVRQSTDTYFAGPTIQYDCAFAVVTVGAQAQLPVAASETDDHGFTPDAERLRVLLRIAKSL